MASSATTEEIQMDSTSKKQIFILSGQSNMAGRGGVTITHPQKWDKFLPPECQPDPNILRFTAKLHWELAHEPLHSDIDAKKVCGVGPGLCFANSVRARDPSVGVVGLVPCAVGGTAIKEWERGSHLYENMVKRAKESVRDGGGEVKALLWYQGESDTNSKHAAEIYGAEMEILISNVRADLGSPLLPIIQMDRNQRRRIPGPAGEWQAAMQRRENNPDDPILRRDFKTTQEFVVRAMEHDAKRAAAEDEDFRSPLWMNALQFAGHNHTSPTLDTIIRTRGKDHYRVSLVVAVIKTCTQNGLGDLIVTLKDPTGVIGGNIHRKVVADEEWAGKIGVGSIMVLEKVVVFSTSRTAQYLNITKPNVLKVFSPSTGEGSGANGVSVVPTGSQGLERPSGSLVVCQTERVQEQVSTMSTPDCGNEMNIAEQLTDEQVTQLLEDW